MITLSLATGYNQTYVIKHLYTKTLYGIFQSRNLSSHKTPCVVCFEKQNVAKHVINSINTFKTIHNRNPENDQICLYNTNHIIKSVKSYEYGLYHEEMYLSDLMNYTFNRNLGMYLIQDVYYDDLTLNVQSICVLPYEYNIKPEILEIDFELS